MHECIIARNINYIQFQLGQYVILIPKYFDIFVINHIEYVKLCIFSISFIKVVCAA